LPRISLGELWQQRDLVYLLARRDIAVRYKQAAIGTFWAILQPVFLAVVFSLFFGALQKVEAPEGIPYPLFAVSGMVMWLFFANAMQTCSESTTASAQLISKVYFPRMAIPIAAIAPAALDFAIGFVVVVVVTLAYGFSLQIQLLLLPVVAALALATALGIGLWLSALNVKYRDVHLLVPFVILVGLFMSPIIYPFDLVPEHLQPLYALNPMVGVLEAYRWMLLGTDWPGTLMLIPIAASLILTVTGAVYFRKAEQVFADVI